MKSTDLKSSEEEISPDVLTFITELKKKFKKNLYPYS
jgi:hypothetical protein